EFSPRQSPGIDARGPQRRHAVLKPAGAVRDLAEIANAEPLLLRCESAVIGRDHLQRARLKPSPQTVLMRPVAERRRHHATRRMVPALVLIVARIEQEMLDQRLAIDAFSRGAGARDRLMRLAADGVHDIAR